MLCMMWQVKRIHSSVQFPSVPLSFFNIFKLIIFWPTTFLCWFTLTALFNLFPAAAFVQQLGGFFFKKALKTHCALCLYQTAGTNSEFEDLAETKTECVAWILDLNSSWWPQPWLKRLGEDCGQRSVSTFSFYLFEKSTIEYFLQWTI